MSLLFRLLLNYKILKRDEISKAYSVFVTGSIDYDAYIARYYFEIDYLYLLDRFLSGTTQ